MVNVDKINEIVESLQKDARQLNQISMLCAELNNMGADIKKNAADSHETIQMVKKAVDTLQQYKDKQDRIITMLGSATAELERRIKLSEDIQNDNLGKAEETLLEGIRNAKQDAVQQIIYSVAKDEVDTRALVVNAMTESKADTDKRFEAAQAERKSLMSLCKALLAFSILSLGAIVYMISLLA